jgi:hypothetical protein
LKQAKSFDISKQVVWEAYQRVKANRGSAGVDAQSIQDFEVDLKDNLCATSEACYFLQGASPCLEFKGLNS